MPTTEKDIAKLRAAYGALQAGDLAPLGQLMAEDVRWVGDISMGDPPPECVGREQALAVMRRALGRVPNRDLEKITVSGDTILAVARWKAGTGPDGRDRVFSVVTLRDGRIVRMQDYFDRAAAEAAFGSHA